MVRTSSENRHVSRDNYARARRVALRRLAFFAALHMRGRPDARRIWASAAIARKLERLVRAARAAASIFARTRLGSVISTSFER